MEGLGRYEELLPGARLLGQGFLVLALLFTALLEVLQLRLRTLERSRWWASNGRDVLNALALVSVWGALLWGGFSAPIALAAAGILVVLASVLESALAQAPRAPRGSSMLLMLVLGSPLLIAPAQVHLGLRATLEALF